MAFDWSKYEATSPEPTANEAGAKAFDWAKYEAVASPQTENDAKSAVQAFQESRSNASYVSDKTGKQTYANPISLPAAGAASAIKGATELPFAGNLGGQAIAGATGVDQRAYEDFQAAVEEQHPYFSAAAEGVGALANLPAEAAIGSAKVIGRGIKGLTKLVSSGALQYGSKALEAMGIPGVKRIASIMLDDAAQATPRVLAKEAAATEKATQKIGSELGDSYKALDKVVTKDVQITNQELHQVIKTNILKRAEEENKILSRDYVKTLDDELDNWLGDLPANGKIPPSKLHRLAADIDREAGTFTAVKPPKTTSTPAVMSDISRQMRDRLDDYVTQASTISGDSTLMKAIETQKQEYGLLSKGNRLYKKQLRRFQNKEVQQAAADRAAQILSNREKLGKFYNVLKASIPRGLNAVAASHANLLQSNEQYRNIVEEIDDSQGND